MDDIRRAEMALAEGKFIRREAEQKSSIRSETEQGRLLCDEAERDQLVRRQAIALMEKRQAEREAEIILDEK